METSPLETHRAQAFHESWSAAEVEDLILVLPSRRTSGTVAVLAARLPRAALRTALRHADGVRILDTPQSGMLGELSLALTASAPEPEPSNRAALLAQAKRHIEANLEDPDLSPETIARGIYVSARYLHILFKQEELSVSKYVIAQRLARSLVWMTDPRRAHLPIADISSRLGFKDPSHFARVFKSTYGMSPREYRTTARRLPPAAGGENAA